MSVYFPQAAVTLRVMWEDFGEVQSARLQKIYTLSILARSVTVNINDYTQADTFNCEIDYKMFPFDPRSIRSCGVTISMQDMGGLYDDDKTPRVIDPSTTNTLFVGFVDEEGLHFDDSKRTVHFEGRDLTALLIDRKYAHQAPLDLTKPLDDLIRELLHELPELKVFKVVSRLLKLPNLADTGNAAELIESSLSGKLPTVAKFASDKSSLSTVRNRRADESYWEVIQDLVSRIGLVAYVEIDKLVITNPRALYSTKKAVQFVYGKNIKNLQFKRKLGRKKNFNVLVKSFSSTNKGEPVITAEIPLESTAEWSNSIGVPQKRVVITTIAVDGSKQPDKDAPMISISIPNIRDKKQLIENGQSVYEELGRQQIEGSFETREMEGMDGIQNCISLLTLRNGSPVKITVDQGDLSGVNKIIDRLAKGDKKEKSLQETTRFLIMRGYASDIASALAESLNNPRFDSAFYTKAVQFTLDSDGGFKIKVDFINFIELPKRLGGTG